MLKARTLLGHLSGSWRAPPEMFASWWIFSIEWDWLEAVPGCSTKNYLQASDIPANIAVTKWGATAFLRSESIGSDPETGTKTVHFPSTCPWWGHRKWRKSPISIISIIWCPKKQTLASLTMEIAPPMFECLISRTKRGDIAGRKRPVENCHDVASDRHRLLGQDFFFRQSKPAILGTRSHCWMFIPLVIIGFDTFPCKKIQWCAPATANDCLGRNLCSLRQFQSLQFLEWSCQNLVHQWTENRLPLGTDQDFPVPCRDRLRWLELDRSRISRWATGGMDGIGVCIMTNISSPKSKQLMEAFWDGNAIPSQDGSWRMRGQGTIRYASSIIEWTPADRDKSCWEPTFCTNWPHDKRI